MTAWWPAVATAAPATWWGPVAARAAVALAVDGTEPPPYFRSSLLAQ